MDTDSKPSSRLPEIVVPIHYNLEIAPDVSHRSYTGRVMVSIDVLAITNKVILNGAKHTIESAKLVSADKVVTSTKIGTNQQFNQVVIVFDEPIPIGVHDLEIIFENKLDTKMKGLYLTTYYDDSKLAHECLVTNFEPDDASLAFPCFDEPCFKATFKLMIKYLANKTVVSNTPLEYSESDVDGLVKYHFKTTPKMSTYLVAFAMGDFTSVSKTSHGIKYSIYGPVGKEHQMGYALGACEAFIQFYSDFFGIPYPLEKLDLIAIPDISIGAMENWGLVTFRDDLLLFDSKLSSQNTKKNVSLVIAHELAHQWFGNLVTMKWWTDIWLNEGFANWIEYLAVDSVFPELKVWKYFNIANYGAALEADSYSSSHPIEMEANLPSDLDDIFDHITYCKGASVINMMYKFVGSDNLRSGLRDYMVKYQYKNVSTQDLWDCLEKVSQKPVSKLIGSFTRQMGHPVIHVTTEPSTDDSNTICFKFEQNMFLFYSEGEASSQQWVVPVYVDCVCDTKTTQGYMLLVNKSDKLLIEGCQNTKFILLNPGRSGFYRIHYSDDMYSKLLTHLKDLQLEDRIGLLVDYYSFARSGLICTDKYLNLVARFSEIGEENEEIWRVVIRSLNDIHSLLYFSPDYSRIEQKFEKFCCQIMRRILDKFHFTADKFDYDDCSRTLVSSLLTMLCRFDLEIRSKLLKWFEDYRSKKVEVLPDFRICMFHACYLSKPHFLDLMKYLEDVTMTEEKIDIFVGASAANDPEIIRQLYELSISKKVRPQDSRFIYTALSHNPHSFQIGWDFLKGNFQAIKDFYQVPMIVSRVISYIIGGFCSMEKYHECSDFLQSSQSAAVKQSLESIKVQSRWFTSDERKIVHWFEKY